MKTSSAKAKGRRAAQEVADLILDAFPFLPPEDIVVTSSGETGEDLKFSKKVRDLLPIAVEVKNQEALNIWAALKQAESHSEPLTALHPRYTPVLFFRRNRSKLYAALPAEELLNLYRRIAE